MSRNKHQSNRYDGIAQTYMTTVLGPWEVCPKSRCDGTLVQVLTRYKDHGTLNREKECATCGKVVKDPRFRRNKFRKNNDSYSRSPRRRNNYRNAKR